MPGMTATVPTAASAAGDTLRRLREAKAWIFDMDGILYRGTEPLPGVQALLDLLASRGHAFMLATNNSMATAAQYVERLAVMGITAPAESILTSAVATRDFLARTLSPGDRVFVIGMPALSAQLFDSV